MSHHHKGVKPQGRIDAYLGVQCAEHGGQPAALPRVHQEEHRIVREDQLLQKLNCLPRLLNGLGYIWGGGGGVGVGGGVGGTDVNTRARVKGEWSWSPDVPTEWPGMGILSSTPEVT